MYGIINVAIQDFAVQNYGPEKWEVIKEQSGIDVDYSLTDSPYNDTIPYIIARTASAEMQLNIEDVLNDLAKA